MEKDGKSPPNASKTTKRKGNRTLRSETAPAGGIQRFLEKKNPGENKYKSRSDKHKAGRDGVQQTGIGVTPCSPHSPVSDSELHVDQTTGEQTTGENMASQSALATETDGKGHEREDILLAAIQDIRKELKDGLVGLKKEFGVFREEINSLKEVCAKNSQHIEEVSVSVEFAHKEIGDTKNVNAEQGKKIWSLEKKLSGVMSQNAKTEEKLNDLERRSREYNIRIAGVKEARGENCRVVAAKVIANAKWAEESPVDDIVQHIEVAHRVGKARGPYPRQILVRMVTRGYASKIVRSAKRNRGPQGAPRAFQDLTAKDHQMRQQALPEMAEAYNRGLRVSFIRGRLRIGGRRDDIPDRERWSDDDADRASFHSAGNAEGGDNDTDHEEAEDPEGGD